MTSSNESAAVDRSGPGRLVIAGTGIRSIGQLTLETDAWIGAADVVCYALADPVTERWVRERGAVSEDLSLLYDTSTTRLVTYATMAARMVEHARRGRTVLGLFYGHPGVFTSPSHWAVAMAREAGIPAQMLPGVSAEDCLFADVGVDPGSAACENYEATDMLLRDRSPGTTSHVIIWQIGVIGQNGFGQEPNGDGLRLLTDHLLRTHPADHEVVHYRAPQTVLSAPMARRIRLADLPQEATAVTSTLYVPPVTQPAVDLTRAARLGLDRRPADGSGDRPETPEQVWALADARRIPDNPLPVPPWHRPVSDIGSLYPLIAALSTDASLLLEFQAAPAAFVAGVGLDTVEAWAALFGGDAWVAECVRSGNGADAAVSLGVARSAEDVADYGITPDGRLVRPGTAR